MISSIWGEHHLVPRDTNKLALHAIRTAMKVRQQVGVDLLSPVSIYDVIQEPLKIEVWFANIPSMEAMYRKGNPPAIVISSMRPSGRQAFNAAHELGHHIFGHGTRIDELLERDSPNYTPEEYLADTFAGIFLMPKSAIARAFTIRGWDPATCTAHQAFIIAGCFGVGYATLLEHLSRVLRLTPKALTDRLKRIAPKQIRAEILGQEIDEDLIIVDNHWNKSKAIDIQVGDVICLPPQIVNEKIGERHCVARVGEDGQRTLLKGERPGIGRLINPSAGWAGFVRVARPEFAGRSIYRHREDPDDE